MQPGKGPFGDSIARALAGSLVLHAVVGTTLWQLPGAPAAVVLPGNSVAIELRTLRELPEAEPPAEPASETRSEPEPDPTPEPAPTLQPAPEPTPEPATEPASVNVEPEPATVDLAEAGVDTEATRPANESLLPEGVDIEAVHRVAIARVIESLRAEAQYRTFSVEDLPGAGSAESIDADGDGSEFDVFERAARLKSDGPLTPGRSRSPLIRRIAFLCNELTGGFSIFGMGNVCDEPRARADLFGHLRPEYMESVPLCAAEEDLDLEVERTGSGAIGVLKCVLVPRAVRAEFYGRFDPELAGWLPAESSRVEPGPASARD